MDAGTGNGLPAVLIGTVVKRMLSSLARDERYKKDIQGLHAVIAVVNRCCLFLESVRSVPPAWSGRIAGVMKLLSDPRIEKLRKTDVYQSLPLKMLVYYNHLLRGKLFKEMEDLLQFIYELDVFITVSSVAEKLGFAFAKALGPEKNILSAGNLRHPCVENAIGNPVLLDEESNVLFLTGANMAGKSTFMKAIAISVYLAHIGFPVAAENMEFSVRDGLFSSINVSDNINLGYSHFYAEVVRVKQAAEAAASGKRLLLLFDELFKGTNVKDAYDGTLAVTEGFSGYTDCIFIVSTHIIEVGMALQSHDNIRFAYMPTVMEGVRPRYTYRIREGITEDRQGMMIIRNEGILELIGE